MTRRRFTIAAVAVAGLCLALVAASLVVLRTSWFREKVRERIVSEVEQATGGRVGIGAFHYDGGAMRAEVRDFVLHGTEEPGAPPLLRARRIAVRFKLASFLRRDIDIRSLEIEAPELRIAVHPDGSTNLPHPRVPRHGTRNVIEQFLALAIERVDVYGGTVECGIEKAGIDLHGEQLRARLFYEASPEKYRGEVSVRQASLKSRHVPAGPLDVAASVELEGGRLALRNASLRTAKSTVNFEGTVGNWLSPRVEAKFTGDISLAEFAKAWSLPVAPRGVASLQGTVRYDESGGWQARSTVSASGLAVDRAGVRIAGASLHAFADWTPDRLTVSRLSVAALGGRFDGTAAIENNTQLRIDGRIRGLPLDRAFAARGLAPPPWSGAVSGEVQLRGALGSPVRRVAATLDLTGPSVRGGTQFEYDQYGERLSLGKTTLETAVSRIELQGDPGKSLRVVVETRDLRDLAPAFSLAGVTLPHPLPIELKNGAARFEGAVTGGLRSPRIEGRVALRDFLYEGRKFERASASIDLTAAGVRIDRLAVEYGKLRVTGQARLGLRDFRIDPPLPLDATLAVDNADLATLLPPGYRGPELSGIASAHFTVQGTMDQPGVRGTVEIANASIASQPFDTLRGEVDYAGRRLAISKAQARIGGASVEWSATYTHAAGNWRQGAVRVKLAAADVLLSRLTHWKSLMPAADGHLNAQLEGSAEVNEKGVRVRELLALAESLDVVLGKRPLGSVRFRASTTADSLEIRPRAEVAGAGISGVVRVGLDEAHAVEGALQFRRLALSTLRAWWSQENTEPLPVEAYSEGKLTFRGKGFDPLLWQVRADVGVLEIKPRTDATNSKLEELGLRNAEPIVLEGTLGEWSISHARLLGHDTNLEIGGKVSLGAKGRFDLRFRGGVDLAILHDFEKDLAAAGTSEVDAEVRGPLDDPGLYGRLKLINASLYFSGVPNGIDKANGTVFFDQPSRHHREPHRADRRRHAVGERLPRLRRRR